MAERSFRTPRLLVHAVLLFALGGLTACTTLDNVMVSVFGRSMRDQPSFDPYENPQPAPEHAVPFAAANWLPTPQARVGGEPAMAADVPPPMTQADLLQQNPVVMELENPVEPTDESLARGQELFNRYCAVCHGERGIGAEAYIAERHPTVAAYNLSGPTVQAYPDGYIYGMMRVGRGLMPSYAHAITNFDRWNIVNYVRELQRQANAAQNDGDAGAGAGGAADGNGNAGAGQ